MKKYLYSTDGKTWECKQAEKKNPEIDDFDFDLSVPGLDFDFELDIDLNFSFLDDIEI